MKKTFETFVMMAALFVALSPVAAQAARRDQLGQPSHYIIRMTKLELCEAQGSSIDSSHPPVCANPYVIGTGTKSFDLATVTSGGDVGTYFNINPATWPVGHTFGYFRATLTRTHTIAATVAMPGGGPNDPTSGNCSSAAGNGTATTDAAGTDSAGPAVETNIWEQDVGAPEGPSSVNDLYANGQQYLGDGQTYVQMFPLTANYTATGVMPTVKISFDVAQSVNATYFTNLECDEVTASGPHCCFSTGPTGVHVTFQ